MMPDILKNNLLERSALSLFLQEQEIEIWTRLKTAYRHADYRLKTVTSKEENN